MWNLKAVIIVSIFIMSSLILPYECDDSENNSESYVEQVVDDFEKQSDDLLSVGSRAPEDPAFNGTNNHTPIIVKNSPVSPNNDFSNEVGTLITFNITATDDDEPPNGSHIANATVHVGILGATPAYADLEFWNFTGSNESRKTGRWVYNFTLPSGVQPGQYYVDVNVSDSGNISDGNKNRTFSIENFEIIIHQENRAPEQNGSTVREIMCNEDTPMAYFELDDIFKDSDVDVPPPYTDPDSLSFQMWNGIAWVATHDFGNYTITINTSTGNLTFVPDTNWFNAQNATTPASVPAEDDIMFRSMDMHQANVTHNLTFRVLSINDIPTIKNTNVWILNDNVRLGSGDIFSGDEDALWSIQVLADDVDTLNPTPDTLTFSVENSAELPAIITISSTGLFEFTPTNDEVDIHLVNVKVTDGKKTAYKQITFDINNTNDEPKLTYVWVGTSSFPIINHTVTLSDVNAATEDEEFTFTIKAADEDYNDTLTFTRESGPYSIITAPTGWGDRKWNFSFTPDNDDALDGNVIINISVKDNSTIVDDWVLIDLAVNGVNDPPIIKKVDYYSIPTDKTITMWEISEGEYDNFTLAASDIDGDNLTCKADNTNVTITYSKTNYYGEIEWDISFSPSTSDDVAINFTVSDGDLSDYVILTWDVLARPTITISTEENKKFKMGETILIEGTWTDPDGVELDYIDVNIKFPDGSETTIPDYQWSRLSKWKDSEDADWHFESSYADEYLWEYLTVNKDGTWKYTFDTKEYSAAYDYLLANDREWWEEYGKNDLPTKLIKGDLIFNFRAEDEDYLQAEEQNIKIILTGEGGEVSDSDNDGILDSWEKQYFGDITKCDPDEDPDEDGKTNLEEFIAKTDPTIAPSSEDTDGDGLLDEWEILYFGNITNCTPIDDSDKDGYSNLEEFEAETDPTDETSHPAKKKDDDDEARMLMCGILAIIIIIVIVLVIVWVVMKKKKPQEKHPSKKTVPCTNCSKTLWKGTQSCPYCGEDQEAYGTVDKDYKMYKKDSKAHRRKHKHKSKTKPKQVPKHKHKSKQMGKSRRSSRAKEEIYEEETWDTDAEDEYYEKDDEPDWDEDEEEEQDEYFDDDEVEEEEEAEDDEPEWDEEEEDEAEDDEPEWDDDEDEEDEDDDEAEWDEE